MLSKSIKIEEAIARQDGVITLQKGKVKDEIIQIGEELLGRLDARGVEDRRGDSGISAGMTEDNAEMTESKAEEQSNLTQEGQ